MRNTIVLKVLLIVLVVIQPDNLGHPNILKYVHILLRVLSVLVVLVARLDWAHESYKLSRDDPIQVSVLNALIVFILFHVKLPKVIPAKSYCVLQALQAVEQCAIVEAFALGGIAIVSEYWVV